MYRPKVKLLWMSMFAPISTASSGGSQTFNYYFKQFMQDNRFEIRLISCGMYKEREVVERENSDIIHYIIYWNDPTKRKISKLMNIESKINIFNRNAQLISNTDQKEIKQTLFEYKNSGFIPDVVILEWTNMVMLASMIRDVFPSCKIVASEHDVTFIGYQRKMEYFSGIRRFIWKLKYQHEKKLEIKNLELCDLVLPHNADNKEILVAEGLDDSKIQGLVPYYTNMTLVKRESNYRDILFFGAMSRPENSLSAKWFIDKVLPQLRDLDVRFVILGSNPPENLKQLESERIHITGFVDSVEPYFTKSMCLVAPLILGAGIKIKVLEALSSGIPVLTNYLGIEGIPAERNKDYFYCADPAEYERVIRKIYNGEIDEISLESNAKDFIKNHFSVDKFSETYKNKLVDLGRRSNDNN